jgi:hypothetical protein
VGPGALTAEPKTNGGARHWAVLENVVVAETGADPTRGMLKRSRKIRLPQGDLGERTENRWSRPMEGQQGK